jgi:hypothetical protein
MEDMMRRAIIRSTVVLVLVAASAGGLDAQGSADDGAVEWGVE